MSGPGPVSAEGIHLAAVFEAAPVGIGVLDARWSIRMGNAALARLLGRDASRLVGLELLAVMPPADRASCEQHLGELIAGRRDRCQFDTRIQAPGGEARHVRGHVARMQGAGTDLELVVVLVDVADKDAGLELLERMVQERTAEVRLSNARLRLATAARGVGTWQLDPASGALRWDAQMFKLFGAPPTDGGTLTEGDWAALIVPDDGEELRLALYGPERSNRSTWVNLRCDRGAGQSHRMIEVVSTLAAVGDAPPLVIGTCRDISELLAQQAETARWQRLEMFNRVAAGLAHDFNNSLQPILLTTEMLRDRHPESAQLIDTLLKSSQQAGRLVRRLTLGQRGVAGEARPLMVSEILEEVLPLVEVAGMRSITVTATCPAPVGAFKVLADLTEMTQVVVNLCVNARDAMPGGGELRIEVTAEEAPELGPLGADSRMVYPNGHVEPRFWAVFRVHDTGVGIPPSDMPRMFEAFFTTKPPGLGTGLGLSTSARLVAAMGGFMHLASEAGRGTTATVCIPCLESSAAGATTSQ